MDPYTAHARLCDNTGMISDNPVTPANAFNPQLTYRQQLNNLRAHSSMEPYTGKPIACTGSVHLAHEHIACTSPAHRAEPRRPIDLNDLATPTPENAQASILPDIRKQAQNGQEAESPGACLGSPPRAQESRRQGFPPFLRGLTDFCCDRVAGCGHHIDAHGYGTECAVPDCGCEVWRDHTVCDHRRDIVAAKLMPLLRRVRDEDSLDITDRELEEGHHRIVWYRWLAKEAYELGRLDAEPPVQPAQLTAEGLARLFHESYEDLAPTFGYETREASAKPWAEVPEQNRALMIATCARVLDVVRQPAEAERCTSVSFSHPPVRCTSTAGHPNFDLCGLVFNHANPKAGQYWNDPEAEQSTSERDQ